MPKSLLQGFIKTLWTDECGLINYNHESDPHYLLMLEQLEQQDFFVTLDDYVPWTRAMLTRKKISHGAHLLNIETNPEK